jgi:hypothetical protein
VRGGESGGGAEEERRLGGARALKTGYRTDLSISTRSVSVASVPGQDNGDTRESTNK